MLLSYTTTMVLIDKSVLLTGEMGMGKTSVVTPGFCTLKVTYLTELVASNRVGGSGRGL
jgi:hypothetical protein